MEIWLDTTNIQTVKKASQYGLIRGVTTNPTLIAQSQRSLEEVLEDLLNQQSGPVTAQVVSDDPLEMVQQGQALYSFSNRLIIKVPVTKSGLEAIHLLSKQNIPTMATAVYHTHQALLAALAGADYAAPYLGRIEKAGMNPWSTLQTIVHLTTMYRLKMKILAASLQGIDDVMQNVRKRVFTASRLRMDYLKN